VFIYVLVRVAGFLDLPIVRDSKYKRKQFLGKWVSLRPQVRGPVIEVSSF
jgi:hypothetical protein